MMNKKLECWIMSFSYQERRKKRLEKYIYEMKAMNSKSEDELNMDYIDFKTQFEHKRRSFSVFVITILLSILMNIWGNICEFMLSVIKHLNASQTNKEELVVSAFLICMILLVAIALIFFIELYVYLKDMKELNKKLMMIEQIKSDVLKKRLIYDKILCRDHI